MRVMWFQFPHRLTRSQSRTNVRPRLARRLRLDPLEDRLLPADPLLGAALGSLWLNPSAILDADPVPAALVRTDEASANNRLTSPEDRLTGKAGPWISAPATSPVPAGSTATRTNAPGGDTAP